MNVSKKTKGRKNFSTRIEIFNLKFHVFSRFISIYNCIMRIGRHEAETGKTRISRQS